MRKEDLFDCCRRRDLRQVEAILKEHRDIDVIYAKEEYLKHVITWKDSDILGVLLDYYEKTKLPYEDRDTQAYNSALLALRSSLQNIVKGISLRNIPEDMQKLLGKYIVLKDYCILSSDDEDCNQDDESEQDLSGFDDPDSGSVCSRDAHLLGEE